MVEVGFCGKYVVAFFPRKIFYLVGYVQIPNVAPKPGLLIALGCLG